MDRFVPNRSAMDVESAHLFLTNENSDGQAAEGDQAKEEYQRR